MSNVRSVLGTTAALLLTACASPAPTRNTAALEEAPRHCVRSTGTQLPLPEGKCVSSPGRVFTRDDLERSGSMTTTDALRRLLPR